MKTEAARGRRGRSRIVDATRASADVEGKLSALRERMRELGSVLVCYSGGIDSALVLAVAHAELGPRAIGLTATSASVLTLEVEEASAVARDLGADHRIVASNEIDEACNITVSASSGT